MSNYTPDMPDYLQLEKNCRLLNKVSAECIDSFLVYYAAAKDKLDKQFDQQLARYKKTVKKLPASWVGLAKSQFIAHRVFCEGGRIQNYLKHAAVKDLPTEQYRFLQQQAETPWMYRFCSIVSKPAPDFFVVEDIFREEEYLLFSPSLTQTLAEQPVTMFFVLTGFNGECWQTFGPFTPFASFDADDIFYFATEINREIGHDDELIEDVENNPVPYMLLIVGSQYPRMVQGEHEIVQVTGSAPTPTIDVGKLKKTFTIGYTPPVFKLVTEESESAPWFAEAYFNESSNTLSLFALTDEGYRMMQKKLAAEGLFISEDPDIRVHLPMLEVIKEITGRKIEVNPYQHLFEVKKSPAAEETLEKLNKFLKLAIDLINAGKEPDIEALATQVGVDPEQAREIIVNALERVKQMKGGRRH